MATIDVSGLLPSEQRLLRSDASYRRVRAIMWALAVFFAVAGTITLLATPDDPRHDWTRLAADLLGSAIRLVWWCFVAGYYAHARVQHIVSIRRLATVLATPRQGAPA